MTIIQVCCHIPLASTLCSAPQVHMSSESWNPVWSVSTIIQGLISFMSSEDVTAGSVNTDNSLRRELAASSLKYNVKNRKFAQLFPDLVKLHNERSTTSAAASGGGSSSASPAASAAGSGNAAPAPHAAGGAAAGTQPKAEAQGVCGTGFTGFSVFVAAVLGLSVLFLLLADDEALGATGGQGDYEL